MPVSTKLYNGLVDLVYDDILHTYTVDGVPMPSVTGITGVMDKPALIGWAVKVTAERIAELWQPGREYTAEQIREAIFDAKGARYRASGKAMTIGTMAHDWIEQYIKSKIYGFAPPEEHEYPKVASSVSAFLSWEQAHAVKYFTAERKVLSVKHGYSGTVDSVMTVDGKRLAVDLKTSKAIYPEYFIQCAAYAAALEEELGVEYDGIAILRVDKESGAFEFSVIEDGWRELFDVFLACLTIWRWRKKNVKD